VGARKTNRKSTAPFSSQYQQGPPHSVQAPGGAEFEIPLNIHCTEHAELVQREVGGWSTPHSLLLDATVPTLD